jgi:hypothetical protein
MKIFVCAIVFCLIALFGWRPPVSEASHALDIPRWTRPKIVVVPCRRVMSWDERMRCVETHREAALEQWWDDFAEQQAERR